MCQLCYQDDDVPESAKITDCYEPGGRIAYRRATMRIHKRSYQSRPVAVHVLMPRLTHREGWRRVRSIVVLDPTGDFSDLRLRDSAKRLPFGDTFGIQTSFHLLVSRLAQIGVRWFRTGRKMQRFVNLSERTRMQTVLTSWVGI